MADSDQKTARLVLLISPKGKRYLLRLQPGAHWSTNLGRIAHDDMLGKPAGGIVQTHLGTPFLLLEPTLADLITMISRRTQIVFPKDAAHILFQLSIRPGSRVIEAGSGSGGMTTALAWFVRPAGQVFSYEVNEQHQQQARKNIVKVGLESYVTFHLRDIQEGFFETDVDALFLDVRSPWRYLAAVKRALRPGGRLAILLPTTNQVSAVLRQLYQMSFADLRVEELLLRRYKPVPDRLRPEDQMIGHSGYMVFARNMIEDTSAWLPVQVRRYLSRRELATRQAAERGEVYSDENDDPILF